MYTNSLVVLWVLISPNHYEQQEVVYEHQECHNAVESLKAYYRGHVSPPKWRDRYKYLIDPPKSVGFFFEDWCNGERDDNDKK